MAGRYRICCDGAADLPAWDGLPSRLFEEPCEHKFREGDDKRLEFGNWYRGTGGQFEDMDICTEHFLELSRMQRRKWKKVESVADLGDAASKYEERNFKLVGDIIGGAEQEAHAATLLIKATRLLG